MIEAVDLHVRAAPGERMLIEAMSLRVGAGEVVAVAGPNGAGKSTLLRALAGELRPSAGVAAVCGVPAADWPPRLLARRRAVVSQAVELAFPLTAAEVVALGRLPWHGASGGGAARDAAAVAAALERAGVAHLARRAYATLSGGERQRVQIARALAQLDGAEPPTALLLDEPTASLDAAHRAGLLVTLRGLAAAGTAVLVVLHDLNEAAFVADRVALLSAGRLAACGPPAAVLRPAALAALYGIPFRGRPGDGLLPDFAAAAATPTHRRR
ncbi:MAG: heme ABC transporter ATP-binding protein [Acetobacteraceae bacterium]|nr:heme ABC transporter ATP-binding protein [Acetobacteraceae bacterium]